VSGAGGAGTGAVSSVRTVAVVPARGGSKRLPGKNLHPVLGRPMLGWVLDAALASGRVAADHLIVSSDDPAILAFARAAGVVALERPAELAGDDVWTEPVLRHAVERWEADTGVRADVVLWLNASIPEVTGEHIAACVDRLSSGGLREVLTVDAAGVLTSAARAMLRPVLDQRALTAAAACVPGHFIDVHTAADVALVEERLRARLPIDAPAPASRSGA
jgi:CMP-2-keto-3-deoxyoctulosonic acid synthetase